MTRKSIASKRSPFGATGQPREIVFAKVVGEGSMFPLRYGKCYVHRFADRMRRNPTRAERQLALILSSLSGGRLKGRFVQQHVVSGKWIVDIFFLENRLAIEIDGGIHQQEGQIARDRQKEQDCVRFDITLLRVTNSEVFGDRDRLLTKLRLGWRTALRRENKIIGKANAD